jgi:hypothetical protein
MKKMKISRSLIALLLVAFVIVFDSCEKTDEDGPTTSDRDAFIGDYAAESTGPGGNRNFTLHITASASAPDQIKMVNFDGGNGTAIFATVSGTSMTIPSQSVSGESYQGNGSINGKNLSITFSVDDGQGTPENRSLTGVKP